MVWGDDSNIIAIDLYLLMAVPLNVLINAEGVVLVINKSFHARITKIKSRAIIKKQANNSIRSILFESITHPQG